MINNKKGSTAIVNLISVIITVIIIVAVGVIYYMFLSPDKLELEEVTYEKLDKKDYEIDREFEEGLDTTVEISYSDDELDMHRDLKDYYQGREDPFSQSDDRNTGIELYPEIPDEEKVTNSQAGVFIPENDTEIESEIKIQEGASTILGF